MKSAIAIAVLAAIAATAVLAQDNAPAISPEEQSRLERVDKLHSEQEWFQLEQMWAQMREQMRQQIREEIREGVPPQQIQNEIQEQAQLQQQEPYPVYVYVPQSVPVQTVFISQTGEDRERSERLDRERRERERWEHERIEHEHQDRERMEHYRVEWERMRAERMKEMQPQVAARIMAGVAKAQTPTTIPVGHTTTSPTMKSPTAVPSAPRPSPSVHQPPPPPPPAHQPTPPPTHQPPPAPITNKGTPTH